MKHWVQIIGVLIVFLASALKELALDRKGRTRTRSALVTYWALTILGLGTAIAASLLEQRQSKIDEAVKSATYGRNAFNTALENDSLPDLQVAAELLLDLAERGLPWHETRLQSIQVLHDLALANERLAYKDADHGCRYSTSRPDQIDACSVAQGSTIFVAPKTLRQHIHCTDILDMTRWSEARKRYEELRKTIEEAMSSGTRAPTQEEIVEIAKAARSIAYFNMCDGLRIGEPHLSESASALDLGYRATANLEMRRTDILNKTMLFNIWKNSGGKAKACDDPCVSDGTSAARFFEWRGRTLSALNSHNLSVQQGFIALPVGQTAGHIETPVKSDIAKFRQIVLSWDATTPLGSKIRTQARARVNSQWSKWYKLQEWSSGGGRKSGERQEDDVGHVEADTLILRHDADAAQVQIELEAEQGAASPTLRALALSVSGGPVTTTHLETLPAAHGVDLRVPQLSQRDAGPEGDSWCGPTSVAMVLAYWADETGVTRWRTSVADFAASVRDERDGASWQYGNWSFNVAQVNAIGEGDLRAFVTRFDGIEQLERLVLAGIPVVVSASWRSGELDEAAIASTNGHLMVVRGFSENGDVIVNDPASPTDGVRRKLRRKRFDSAWSNSGRAGYVIHPIGRVLPSVGAQGCW